MTFDVVEYQIQTDYTGYPNWVTPRRIVIIFNDVTWALTVEIRTGSGTVIESPTSGPQLYLGVNGYSTVITSSPYHQFCDSTTLRKISLINTFPYATLAEFPNHNLCQVVPVCDLTIESLYTVVPTTDTDSNDGSIQVSSISSNGEVRYSMTPNFSYDTASNTSGLFAGLFPGTYTIYAKDAVDCYSSITIIVPVTLDYAVLYRGEYDDLDGKQTKIEILSRGFDGSSTEICFSGDPFNLHYQERTKYSACVASYCEIELLEETEDQFQEIFTQDERKYRVDYYKDLGSGWVLYWTGFVVPQIYQQSFVRRNNNYVLIKASDQLGNMKNEKFLDDSGNIYQGDISQMSIICEILKKTGLTINIRSADTIFDAGMDEMEDPLTQGFVDTRIFYDTDRTDKCDVVLNKVINCKSGLCLFQAEGYWWLVRSEDQVGDFDWREFDLTGLEVSSGTYSPLIDRVLPGEVTGMKWAESSQRKAFDLNYGRYTLTHILSFDDNFIDEGRFEAEDLVDLGNGDKGFKNWNVNMIQSGIKLGLEFVDNGDSRGAFSVLFHNVFDAQAENSLYCVEIPIESSVYASANKIKFRFQYTAIPEYSGVPWIRLGWQVRITDSFSDELFLRSLGGWSDSYPVNDIYITKYGEFNTFEVISDMPNQANLTGTVRVAFFFHNHVGRDFGSIAALQALLVDESQNTVLVGQRYLVYDTSSQFTHFVELQYSDEAESLPDIIHPADWNATTNPRVWRSIGKAFIGLNASTTKKILIDNVQVSYVPFDPINSLNFDPPENVEYDQVVNKYNKLPFEEDFYLGDLPDIENAKYLYRGYLRLADGTPTTLWHRIGVSEEKYLLQLALTDRITQTQLPVKRIESVMRMAGVYYSYLNILRYDNERFINGGYSINDKNCLVSLILLNMETGADGEPPAVSGEFSDAFSDAFNNGE